MSTFNTKDYYFNQAKAQGFNARSVYKLQEMDATLKLIKPNSLILDLGCAPGSWLQYVDQKLNKQGAALGIDLSPVNTTFKNNIKCLQDDVFLLTKDKLADYMSDLTANFTYFDVILSDMAPKTSGIRHLDQTRSYDLAKKVFELSLDLLKPKGSMIIKIFAGGEVNDLIKKIKPHFIQIKQMRPPSVRSCSKEFYLVALSKK